MCKLIHELVKCVHIQSHDRMQMYFVNMEGDLDDFFHVISYFYFSC